MIEYLQELGYTDSEGKPLSWVEIESWCALTGTILTSWEAKLLKQLSSEFAMQQNKKDYREPLPKR